MNNVFVYLNIQILSLEALLYFDETQNVNVNVANKRVQANEHPTK